MPLSNLTPEELLRVAGFSRPVADNLDRALHVTASPPYVDMRAAPHGVVPNDPSFAAGNTAAINAAFTALNGSDPVLWLPAGRIYVTRALGSPAITWAIRMGPTIKRVSVRGQGPFATTLVLIGPGYGGELNLLTIDGARDISFSELGFEQEFIANPDFPGDHHALVNIVAGTQDTRSIWFHRVRFGPCIGDAFRLVGDGVVGYQVRDVLLDTFIMETGGHVQGAGGLQKGSRSGISFQRGFDNIVISNGIIRGAKNSPFEMEPSPLSIGQNTNVLLSNLIVDNSQGSTRNAASFVGSVNYPLTGLQVVNMTCVNGGVAIGRAQDVSVSNLHVRVGAGAPSDIANAALVQCSLRLRNVTFDNTTLVRDVGAPAGPLVTVIPSSDGLHVADGLRFSCGSWVSRVASGTVGRYFEAVSGNHITVDGIKLRLEGATTSEAAITFRSQYSMHGCHVSNVDIESGAKLARGVYFAGSSGRALTGLRVDRLRAPGAVTTGVEYLQEGADLLIDTSPDLRDCDLTGCTNPWVASGLAQDAVYPVIGGHRGGVCERVGTVAPEGVVTAPQGSKYLHLAGNSTHLYFKSTGTGSSGWTELA